NYHPISIICETCKVLEKIIKSTLTEYLESNNLIHNAQLLIAIDQCKTALDNGQKKNTSQALDRPLFSELYSTVVVSIQVCCNSLFRPVLFNKISTVLIYHLLGILV
ncbi:hypothetical protein CAPTEDRAFT_105844, partial [Capitella teleta]